jgi:hypothetical protein
VLIEKSWLTTDIQLVDFPPRTDPELGGFFHILNLLHRLIDGKPIAAPVVGVP